MQTWKDDDFLLGFKFSRVQTSRKRFYDFLLWTFKTSGGVLYEQFMGDFTYHDSASRQVQYFKSLYVEILFNNTQDVNFRATSLLHLLSVSTHSGIKTLFFILNM